MWFEPRPLSGLRPFVHAALLLLLLVAGPLISVPASVGVGDYMLTTWRTEDGLPENSVNALEQTSDGFLWVGTRNGIARFDGLNFITHFPDDTPASTFGYARRMAADGETLWVVSNNGHVLEQTGGRFKSWWQPGKDEEHARFLWGRIEGSPGFVLNSGALLTLPPGGSPGVSGWADMLRSVRTSTHALDGSGVPWFITKDGQVARLRAGRPEPLPAGSGLEGRVVQTLCRNADGEICAGTEREAAVFRHGRFQKLVAANVSNLFPSQDGGLWIWADGGLRRWHTNGLSTTIAWPAGTQVWGAVEDNQGNLWCGTFGTGLWRVSPTGEYLRFTKDEGLPGNQVLAVVRDSAGNIWAGIEGGLARVSRRVIEMSEGAEVMTERMMTTVCPDRNGGMWAGTYGGGLYHRENGVWRRHPVPGFPTNMFVYAVLTDSHQRTWVGTRGGGGLICLENGRATRPFKGLPAETSVKALWEDSRQRVWIGSDEGCSVLEPQAVRPALVTTALDIRAFAETSDGSVWIGSHGSGLFRWRGETLDRFSQTNGLLGNSIWSLLSDEDGGLWIGTPNRGLAYWKDGKGTVITSADGLPDDTVCHLVEDRTGHVWGSTLHGIFRVHRRDLRARVASGSGQLPCIIYGREDGLRAEQCRGGMQPAGMMGEDGRLWFPTLDGLASIAPERIETKAVPPGTFINGFTVGGVNLPAGGQAPAGSSRIALSFTAPSLSAADKVHFRYRLAGLREGWTEIGTRRDVMFDTLRPGSYRFEVAARHPGGEWGTRNASLAFTVLPFFWQRASFQVPVAALLVLLLVLVVRWFSQRGMRRQLALAAQQAAVERERVRIARDMHDDVGSALTQLTLLGSPPLDEPEAPAQTEARLSQVTGLSREIVAKLDELVWAVNPRHDTTTGLVDYLCQHADAALRPAGLRLRFDIAPGISTQPIASDRRHQLFLAFKEALANVVKHAAATEVHLRIRADGGPLQVIVEDNGRGFDPAGVSTTSDGLFNMRQRLTRIGGEALITRPEAGGTRVEFSLPLAEA